MASINLNILTIPTPEPYNQAQPSRQWENLCYVLLQAFWQAKEAAWTESDAVSGGGSGGTVDLTAVNSALATIATAVSGVIAAIQGISLTVNAPNLSGVEQALYDLQMRSAVIDFGGVTLRYDGKTASLEY